MIKSFYCLNDLIINNCQPNFQNSF